MFDIQLQWRDFPVNLQIVETWIKTNASTDYIGCSADDMKLTLHYLSDPSAYQDAISIYWSGLNTSSPEATGYVTRAQVIAAGTALKESCLGVTWDEMTLAQHKCVLGLPLTNADLGL